MEAYVVDAFTTQIFGGNQAGVVLPKEELSDETMQQIAAEFKHSETAFVRMNGDGSISLRYFTTAGEVDLCGHATIGSFAMLRSTGRIADGSFTACTRAGKLCIEVSGSTIWMDMAAPRLIRTLGGEDIEALYNAFGLCSRDMPEGLLPRIISTGLADIMMPVKDHGRLMAAVQNEKAVAELSRSLGVVGVHMFCLGSEDCTAECSNFAPLCGIPEECATGTSNGALSYYLYMNGLVRPDEENVFLQGEHMHRKSEIRSILTESGGQIRIRVGGAGVVSMCCDLKI